ncbi:MAG: hypothetical protein O3A01_02690 [bacterium]|nr:hypothetical protein [bacterium]
MQPVSHAVYGSKTTSANAPRQEEVFTLPTLSTRLNPEAIIQLRKFGIPSPESQLELTNILSKLGNARTKLKENLQAALHIQATLKPEDPEYCDIQRLFHDLTCTIINGSHPDSKLMRLLFNPNQPIKHQENSLIAEDGPSLRMSGCHTTRLKNEFKDGSLMHLFYHLRVAMLKANARTIRAKMELPLLPPYQAAMEKAQEEVRAWGLTEVSRNATNVHRKRALELFDNPIIQVNLRAQNPVNFAAHSIWHKILKVHDYMKGDIALQLAIMHKLNVILESTFPLSASIPLQHPDTYHRIPDGYRMVHHATDPVSAIAILNSGLQEGSRKTFGKGAYVGSNPAIIAVYGRQAAQKVGINTFVILHFLLHESLIHKDAGPPEDQHAAIYIDMETNKVGTTYMVIDNTKVPHLHPVATTVFGETEETLSQYLVRVAEMDKKQLGKPFTKYAPEPQKGNTHEDWELSAPQNSQSATGQTYIFDSPVL